MSDARELAAELLVIDRATAPKYAYGNPSVFKQAADMLLAQAATIEARDAEIRLQAGTINERDATLARLTGYRDAALHELDTDGSHQSISLATRVRAAVGGGE
jgi:hypothetical protein